MEFETCLNRKNTLLGAKVKHFKQIVQNYFSEKHWLLIAFRSKKSEKMRIKEMIHKEWCFRELLKMWKNGHTPSCREIYNFSFICEILTSFIRTCIEREKYTLNKNNHEWRMNMKE